MISNPILIVDDEPAIREMVAVALELADFDVLEADNAQRAHEYIVDERPDLVLLDWMLPSVSGIELARRLKRKQNAAAAGAAAGAPNAGAAPKAPGV